jgi:GTP cyclohydrolase III
MAPDVLMLMSAAKRQNANVHNVCAKTRGVVMIAHAPVAFSTFMSMTHASVRRFHHPNLGGLFHSLF